jgi:hypothetical protein
MGIIMVGSYDYLIVKPTPVWNPDLKAGVSTVAIGEGRETPSQ